MLKKLESILRKHNCVEEAILFGSRARKTNTRSSDIDVLLIVSPQAKYSWTYGQRDNPVDRILLDLVKEHIILGQGPGELDLVPVTAIELRESKGDKEFWAEIKRDGKTLRIKP